MDGAEAKRRTRDRKVVETLLHNNTGRVVDIVLALSLFGVSVKAVKVTAGIGRGVVYRP